MVVVRKSGKRDGGSEAYWWWTRRVRVKWRRVREVV